MTQENIPVQPSGAEALAALRTLKELEGEVASAEVVLEEAKTHFKECRETVLKKLQMLRSFVRDMNAGQIRLTFGGSEEPPKL
jgi:signal transduction histidine kinase